MAEKLSDLVTFLKKARESMTNEPFTPLIVDGKLRKMELVTVNEVGEDDILTEDEMTFRWGDHWFLDVNNDEYTGVEIARTLKEHVNSFNKEMTDALDRFLPILELLHDDQPLNIESDEERDE